MVNDKLYCCYCGEKFTFFKTPTQEHLVPMSKGGKNSVDNRKNCCKDCNSRRGNKDYADFIAELESALDKIQYDQRLRLEVMIRNVREIKDYVDSRGWVLYTTYAYMKYRSKTKTVTQ